MRRSCPVSPVPRIFELLAAQSLGTDMVRPSSAHSMQYDCPQDHLQSSPEGWWRTSPQDFEVERSLAILRPLPSLVAQWWEETYWVACPTSCRLEAIPEDPQVFQAACSAAERLPVGCKAKAAHPRNVRHSSWKERRLASLHHADLLHVAVEQLRGWGMPRPMRVRPKGTSFLKGSAASQPQHGL